ncbi:MAG: hypothetical protein C5S45_07715 [Candidatus Methanocomedens sp.]|nr:MAG: hypothetical protein C5S45_07715 [ANME-2 cluster archaeon]
MNIKKSISILFTLMITISPALAYQNIGSLDIRGGSSWNIGGGYYIMVEGVDYLGRQGFISIWNEGEMLKEELLLSGEQFEYRDSGSTLIVSMKLSLVFRGTEGSVCRFSDINLRYGETSDTPTSTPTPTPAPTATSIDTPSPRSTEDIKFGDGAPIPGLSTPIVALLMLVTAILLKKRE